MTVGMQVEMRMVLKLCSGTTGLWVSIGTMTEVSMWVGGTLVVLWYDGTEAEVVRRYEVVEVTVLWDGQSVTVGAQLVMVTTSVT
jgi:hypothetical protein